MPQPFHGMVIQIEMGYLNLITQRVHIHHKAMVLRGDFHLTRDEIFHGMIGTMVAELQLVSLPPQSQSQDLVSQADPENRHFAQ